MKETHKLISKETATEIALAYREIETAEKLLNEIKDLLDAGTPPDIRDAFGRQQSGLQLGVPSGGSGRRLFDVPWTLAISIIECHIAHHKSKIADLTEKAKSELKIDDAPPPPASSLEKYTGSASRGTTWAAAEEEILEPHLSAKTFPYDKVMPQLPGRSRGEISSKVKGMRGKARKRAKLGIGPNIDQDHPKIRAALLHGLPLKEASAPTAVPAEEPPGIIPTDEEIARDDPELCEHGWSRLHPQPCPECEEAKLQPPPPIQIPEQVGEETPPATDPLADEMVGAPLPPTDYGADRPRPPRVASAILPDEGPYPWWPPGGQLKRIK